MVSHEKIALEEAFGSPHFNANATYPPTVMIEGIAGLPFNEDFLASVASRLGDVPSRLATMDANNISYTVLSLTSPGIEGIFDPKTAIDFASKTNDHVYKQYVKPYPNRFAFLCSVPLQDPEAAANELERAVTQLGAMGVLVNGFTNTSSSDVNEVRYLDEAANEPFWRMLAKLDVPLYLHPRSPPPNQQRLYRGYPNLAQAAYAFTAETAGHALRIMCSGILDRYPHVNIILGHCAEALPFLIHRIDHRMAIGTPGANGPHKKSMMEYFQTNFYATLAGVRRLSTLRCVLEELGEERVMFSIDYPFEKTEEAAEWFDGLEINANTRRAIATENAKRLFKLD